MSLNEEFDIFNDKMQKIGTSTRQEAHAQGLWHQTFHCWVINTSAMEGWRLLFQLRHIEKDTFPNLLDISCAGHLLTGESVEDGLRELKEELGIDVLFSEIFTCGVFAEENIISKKLIDREFCHVFLYECNQSLTEYKFQISEISGLFFINLDDFKQLIHGVRDSVIAKGIVIDGTVGETDEVSREVFITDIVPHPKEYYDFIFHKIHSLLDNPK
jgi:isopentenyldiphosphate isomerase